MHARRPSVGGLAFCWIGRAMPRLLLDRPCHASPFSPRLFSRIGPARHSSGAIYSARAALRALMRTVRALQLRRGVPRLSPARRRRFIGASVRPPECGPLGAAAACWSLCEYRRVLHAIMPVATARTYRYGPMRVCCVHSVHCSRAVMGTQVCQSGPIRAALNLEVRPLVHPTRCA